MCVSKSGWEESTFFNRTKDKRENRGLGGPVPDIFRWHPQVCSPCFRIDRCIFDKQVILMQAVSRPHLGEKPPLKTRGGLLAN